MLRSQQTTVEFSRIKVEHCSKQKMRATYEQYDVHECK